MVTGTMRTPTVPTMSQVSSRWYQPMKARKLLQRIDFLVDRVGPDFLRVVLHHRVDQLLHLLAVGERDALQLAGLLERLELGRVLRRFDLPPVGSRFLARPDDGGLQVRGEPAEGLAREAQRPDGDRMLRHREVRPDFVEL